MIPPASAQTFDTPDVGTGKTLTPAGSVVDGNGGANYLVTFVNDTTGEIIQRNIEVTADAGQTKVYGEDDPTFSYSITDGSLAGTDTFSGALDRDAGQNVGLYAIGVGSLSAGSNYNLSFVSDDFEISQRPITVTAVTDSKIYDATTSSDGTPLITAGTLAFLDTASFSQTFDTPDVGTGKTLTPAGSVVDGNGGANYLVTFVNDTTGEIIQRNIEVTADAGQTKVYGEDDPTFSYSITDGSLAGTDTFSGALDRDAGENVGLYAIGVGSLSAGSNYNLRLRVRRLRDQPGISH